MSSFGPLLSLKAGYGKNAEKLGTAAKRLKEIAAEKRAKRDVERDKSTFPLQNISPSVHFPESSCDG